MHRLLALVCFALPGFCHGRSFTFSFFDWGVCADEVGTEYPALVHTEMTSSGIYLGACMTACNEYANYSLVGMQHQGTSNPWKCSCLFDDSDKPPGASVNTPFATSYANSGSGPVNQTNAPKTTSDSACLRATLNTPAPTTSPTSSPSHTPSETPTRAPSHTPSETPTRAPSDGPTSSPSHAPTRSCVDSRVFVAIDRTAERNVRGSLDFGVNALSGLIDGLQDVMQFKYVSMTFTSLLTRGTEAMVDEGNPDSRNASALAAASRTPAWKSGFRHRSFVLAKVLDGPVQDFCNSGGQMCYLVIVSDGRFRTRAARVRALRLFRAMKSELASDALQTLCLFPSRRTARGTFGRSGSCDIKTWPGKGRDAPDDIGRGLADRIEKMSCLPSHG